LALAQILLAAVTCGARLTISLPGPAPWLPDQPGVTIVHESAAELTERLGAAGGPERLRVWRSLPLTVRAAANRAGVAVIDAPVLATGRLELRWYLREQTISRELHRYGNVIPAGD
ncbi:MAG TPA: hypothetical protein VML54_15470, partial [Candidatus Limnocylindrales bacterium]|nr:hypothetical protein [Candidatus Limnocylindrales bacterium]